MVKEIKTINTAIKRNKPSRPTKEIAESTLYLPMFSTVLDYGCGRGDDIEWLTNTHKCKCQGYDPNFVPHAIKPNEKTRFDIVLCNYTLCVIPEESKRQEIVDDVWHYVKDGGSIVISVRSDKNIMDSHQHTWEKYQDGWITPLKTFQHGYTTDELLCHLWDFDNIGSINIQDKSDYLVAVITKIKS